MNKALAFSYILIFLLITGMLALFFLFLAASFKMLAECYYNITSCPIDPREIVGVVG